MRTQINYKLIYQTCHICANLKLLLYLNKCVFKS